MHDSVVSDMWTWLLNKFEFLMECFCHFGDRSYRKCVPSCGVLVRDLRGQPKPRVHVLDLYCEKSKNQLVTHLMIQLRAKWLLISVYSIDLDNINILMKMLWVSTGQESVMVIIGDDACLGAEDGVVIHTGNTVGTAADTIACTFYWKSNDKIQFRRQNRCRLMLRRGRNVWRMLVPLTGGCVSLLVGERVDGEVGVALGEDACWKGLR